MARIKIRDLPTDKKISRKEMSKVMGGKYIGETEKNLSDYQMEIQSAIQSESRIFQTISNVMKTREDTEEESINNIR